MRSIQPRASLCFIYKVYSDGIFLKSIVYVVGKLLFFGSNETTLTEIKEKLVKSADVNLCISKLEIIKNVTSTLPWIKPGRAKQY